MKKIKVFLFLYLWIANLSVFANEQSLNDVIKETSVYQKYKNGGIEVAKKEYELLKNNKNIKEEEILAMIQLQYEKAQINEVIKIAKDGIKSFPESPSLYVFLGMAYMNNNEFNKAIDAYSKSINLKPTEPSYYNRGQIYYYVKKDYNSAINDLTEALKYTDEYAVNNTKNQAIADIHELRANCYHKNSDFNKAIDDYTIAIKFAPQNPDLYYNRANAKLSKARVQKLNINYQKIIQSANEDLNIAMDIYKKNNNINMYNKIKNYKEVQAVMNTVR